jgi:RHS repeat-associated protein
LTSRLPEKFTGQQRDAVPLTNLDYFGARYYAGGQGRFISPDLPLIDQDPADPQSWNLYSYVRDNPLSYIDPTGQDCVYTDDIDSKGTVSVEQGNCSRKHGTFVNGSIDVNSLTWDSRKRSLGYNYAGSENTIGTGVIGVSRPPSDEFDAKGLAFVNRMAARVDASNEMLATLAGVSVAGGVGAGLYPTAAQLVNEAAFGPAMGRLFFEGREGYKAASLYGTGRLISDSFLGQQYYKWDEPLGRFGWQILSRFWTSGAAGTANIFPSFTNPQSLLWKTELPLLLKNPNVIKIWH